MYLIVAMGAVFVILGVGILVLIKCRKNQKKKECEEEIFSMPIGLADVNIIYAEEEEEKAEETNDRNSINGAK